MAGLEGIDASSMELVDALGARFAYDAGDRIVKPLVRHADFVPVAVAGPEGRRIEEARFGLPVGPRLLTNARRDKLAASPAWKGLVRGGRCLAAVSYVVERDKAGHAYRIQRRDGRVMVVPGLAAVRHYRFASTGNEYDDLGHVQVTGEPNAHVASVHDRFLCELATPAHRDAWMDPATPPEDLLALLITAPDDRYEMVPIAPDVWTRRKDPTAVAAIGPPVHAPAARDATGSKAT